MCRLSYTKWAVVHSYVSYVRSGAKHQKPKTHRFVGCRAPQEWSLDLPRGCHSWRGTSHWIGWWEHWPTTSTFWILAWKLRPMVSSVDFHFNQSIDCFFPHRHPIIAAGDRLDGGKRDQEQHQAATGSPAVAIIVFFPRSILICRYDIHIFSDLVEEVIK